MSIPRWADTSDWRLPCLVEGSRGEGGHRSCATITAGPYLSVFPASEPFTVSGQTSYTAALHSPGGGAGAGVVSAGFGELDVDVDEPVVVENPGVEQLVLEIQAAPVGVRAGPSVALRQSAGTGESAPALVSGRRCPSRNGQARQLGLLLLPRSGLVGCSGDVHEGTIPGAQISADDVRIRLVGAATYRRGSAGTRQGPVDVRIIRARGECCRRARCGPAERIEPDQPKIRYRKTRSSSRGCTNEQATASSDGRTEFNAALPAGTELFREVLDLIGNAGPAEPLGAAASAGEAVGILATICDPSQMISVYKSRRLYQRGFGTLDEVRFRIDKSYYSSVGVESSSLTELRTLVEGMSDWAGWARHATTPSSSCRKSRLRWFPAEPPHRWAASLSSSPSPSRTVDVVRHHLTDCIREREAHR